MILQSLSEAVDWVLETFHAHPERDLATAEAAAFGGEKRQYPLLYLGMWNRPDDDSVPPPEWTLPALDIADSEERAMAEATVRLLAPLQLDNPVSLALGTGVGPGTLAPSFGVRLNAECGYAPDMEMTLDEALAQDVPTLESGLWPQIRQEIERWKGNLPAVFKIRPPDTQGPFNIAHAILGNNVFFAPYDEPEKFAELMRRVTDHWIEAQHTVRRWITPERLSGHRNGSAILAECSVNLVSEDFYCAFILEHDRRAAEAVGAIHVHPCSGPHVFRATWANLPNICSIEAGTMEHRMAAGAIDVDEALRRIGDRPVVLEIGQELPEGREFEFVARDLDRYAENQRLLFGYTGTHFLRRDRRRLRDLHAQLDDYFARKYN